MRLYPWCLVVAACGGSSATSTESTSPPVAALPATPIAAQPAGPPVAALAPVTDTYHGVAVVDPYQWLEADDAAVTTWSGKQNAYARGILDHLPDLEALRSELLALVDAPLIQYGGFIPAGHKLFGFRKQPHHEQGELIVLTDPANPAPTVLLDPAADSNAQRAIDWMMPSPDGNLVAVSISMGGSEEGSLHILGLDGKEAEPPIPNVQRGTGGGAVAWTADSKGLYYTRYPAAGEKPEAERNFWLQVWFHQLGTPADKDHYELGKDLPKIAEITLDADHRGRVLASVENGDGGTFRHYLHDKAGWRQLDDWSDGIVDVAFGPREDLYAISRSGALRGKVLKVAGNAKSAATGKVLIAEGKDSIITDFHDTQPIVVTADRIMLAYQLGGPTELRVFTLDGKPARGPAIPAVSTVGTPIPWKAGVIFGSMGYTRQWMWHYYEPATGAMTDFAELSPALPIDLSGFDVIRELARSKDGTKVPVNIVWPKGAPKDGSTPCIVTGYGGYGASLTPWFQGWNSPLLQRGICYAHVNLRGGGEFGEEWHQAGALTHKQNVFDDFAAAMQLMVAQGYTSVGKLGILGGSNGGLLMGAMITQHPDLMHAVVSEVGIYDMLRFERSPNGAYNTTEFGSVADEDQFKALYAYSPYHHVARTTYPAILMTTGANDPRVSPWQSRKMIAALQAAQVGHAPILLRTTDKAGHGIGSSTTETVDEQAHVFAFMLAQLKP